MRYKLEDLEELCRTHESESLILEFKPCSELRQGTQRKDGTLLTRESLVAELAKDVSSFLNATGGTIIYGIMEKKSRAANLDTEKAFRPGEVQTCEWLTQLIRHNISPLPSDVDVYSVSVEAGSLASPWFLVVEIPQGQQAHQAKDKRYHKRVGSTTAIMEHYEIADAMRREKGPDLELKLTPGRLSAAPSRSHATFNLRLAVTSENYVSAEHGAIRFLFVPPLALDHTLFREEFTDGVVEVGPVRYVDPRLRVGEHNLKVGACRVRWGANHGNVVFPNDWYDFHGASLPLIIKRFADGRMEYGLAAELYTVNASLRRRFFLLHRPLDSAADSLAPEGVDEKRFARFLRERPTEN